MPTLVWKSIPLKPSEVSLARVLRCGQAFRWKNIDNVWSCGIKGRVIFLRQDENLLHYSSLFPENSTVHDNTLEIISDYLNLSHKLADLYEEWSSKDANFKRHSSTFQGIRILRQDPWENLVLFICSTNNNVKRISQMCENLCVHFGEFIASYNGMKYYDFPTPEALLASEDVETTLRELGFGYRAKYIYKTACMITENGLESLTELRNKPYKEAHTALLEYSGVGPKVADCVCLMSLDKHDVVPVDTHVWTIAQRDYKFKSSLKGKTLSQKVYEETGNFFRDLWGPFAGWAHSVLFAADLLDLNNGVNLKNGEAVIKLKKKVVKKTEYMVKKEEAYKVVYSETGRPLRGKKRLEALNSKDIKVEV